MSAEQNKTESDVLNRLSEFLQEEQRTDRIAKSRKSAIEALTEIRQWLDMETHRKLPHGLKNGLLAASERLLGEL